MTIILTYEEAEQVFYALDSDCNAKKYEAMKFFLAHFSQCQQCGEKNPAEIHTCTPKEPVAVWELQEGGWNTIADPDWMESLPIGTKLYTASPQREENCAECGKKSSDGWALYCVKCSEREWQGLTDEEAEHIYSKYWNDPSMFIEAIEAKLKEKNA
jgi:hypothetical protein